MKSIQVSNYIHERIMDKKNSKEKSADAVITLMFEDIQEMIAEFDSFLVDGNILIEDTTTEILNRNRIKFVR